MPSPGAPPSKSNNLENAATACVVHGALGYVSVAITQIHAHLNFT